MIQFHSLFLQHHSEDNWEQKMETKVREQKSETIIIWECDKYNKLKDTGAKNRHVCQFKMTVNIPGTSEFVYT